jgi:tetratricopeptide (TPR) repeat protein
VSGALYLSLAQVIGTANPTTGLAAVDEALKLGIQGDGKYPQRAAYQARGEILEALRRPLEAAEAFFQAGQYHTWDNHADEACKLFSRANGLDPRLVKNYWAWADALLITSGLSKPPYVDPDRIAQSLDVWNRGVTLAPPDNAYYWAYLTRANLATQRENLPGSDRWECNWEALSSASAGDSSGARSLSPLRESRTTASQPVQNGWSGAGDARGSRARHG